MAESRTQRYLKEKALSDKGHSENSSVERLLSEIEKLRGDPGKDGHTPTEGELIRLVKPLIPHVKDGKTPTESELLAIIKPLIPNVKDGETPSDYRILKLIRPLIPVVKDGTNGKDAVLPSLYELAINTINQIEALKGDDRIDYKAIKGLDKFIDTLINNQLVGRIGSQGGPGIVYTDLSLSGTGVPGDPLRVVGGGGTTIEIPSGVINGSNVTFTVTHIPKYVVLNGATYFENDGYTRVELTITMLVIPMTGSTLRSAY